MYSFLMEDKKNAVHTPTMVRPWSEQHKQSSVMGGAVVVLWPISTQALGEGGAGMVFLACCPTIAFSLVPLWSHYFSLLALCLVVSEINVLSCFSL